MPQLRVLHVLTGLAVAAFLVGVVCDWSHVSAAVAALTLADALFGVLGLVLAAMTGAAGVLIAADVRADTAAAQAWHEIHAEAVVIATPAETAPTDRVDALYVAGPQDEGLSRILLAQRFMVPVPLSDIESLAPDRGDARGITQPAGDYSRLPLMAEATIPLTRAAIKPELQAVRTISIADGHGERLTAPTAAQRKLGFQLISSNAVSAGGRKRHNTARTVSAPKRVANAGSRWEWPVFGAVEADRAAGNDFGYSEIVLTDRDGRRGDRVHRDIAPEPAAMAQPACRGPPAEVSNRRAREGRRAAPVPPPPIEALSDIGRPQAAAHAEFVVIDNLGDRVPICGAELDVIEAHLDDVLFDVLGSADTATKPT